LLFSRDRVPERTGWSAKLVRKLVISLKGSEVLPLTEAADAVLRTAGMQIELGYEKENGVEKKLTASLRRNYLLSRSKPNSPERAR